MKNTGLKSVIKVGAWGLKACTSNANCFQAKFFIQRCLTINPEERITAHQALAHPWLSSDDGMKQRQQQDLLPTVRRNFNARRTFKKAVDLVRLSYQLRHKQLMSSASKSRATSDEVRKAEKEIKPVNEGIEQVLDTEK